MKLQTTYTDGVGLRRCDWCLHPALSTADAELLRHALAAIITETTRDRPGIAQIELMAREALACLQGEP